jgi:hypothetical protein
MVIRISKPERLNPALLQLDIRAALILQVERKLNFIIEFVAEPRCLKRKHNALS